MTTGYKIKDKTLKNSWLIISKDAFVCSENQHIIENICKNNGIDDDSISYFSLGKIDWKEIYDLVQTPSFFGERLIVIKDGDITKLNDEDFKNLTELLQDTMGNHIAILLTYPDDKKEEKKLSGKKYQKLFEEAAKNGIFHKVETIDENYLIDMAEKQAKQQDTILSKNVARIIVNNIGVKDIGLIVNEIDKYCAACNYTEITLDIVDKIGVKTVEGSVFDMIDLICRKQPVKAIEKLNKLFYLKTDEMAILGALSTSFVDIHRCKLAQLNQKDYLAVANDFDNIKGNTNKAFRYKKAMNNAQKFSLNAIEEILQLLLKADISAKDSTQNKKQLLYVLVTQIIAKGIR